MYSQIQNNSERVEVTINDPVDTEPCMDIRFGSCYVSVDRIDVKNNHDAFGKIVDWIEDMLLDIDMETYQGD